MDSPEEKSDFELPKPVARALGTYYTHQELAHKTFMMMQDEKLPSGVVYNWDKEADEESFSKAAKKHKISWMRVAGTFFLTVPYYEFYVSVEINNKEDLKRNGILRRIYRRDSCNISDPPSKNRFSEIDLV